MAKRNNTDFKRNFFSRVGNGGFCLRKVKACYDLLNNNSDLVKQCEKTAEDLFFSVCGKSPELDFNVAPYDIACEFSVEHSAQRIMKRNGGRLPFGCHKWFAYDADLFAPLIQKLGYDLQSIKHQLDNLERFFMPKWLIEEAMYRLIQRLSRDDVGDITKYLPTKEFASVRVLMSIEAMKVFEKLTSYDDDSNNIIRKDTLILFYDRLPDLINDLKAESLPHLIIDHLHGDYYSALNDDNFLLTKLKQLGLRYGEHVISFRKEYLKYCEKLFHNLGK